MGEADLDRDERIAHLLDEMHRPGSTLRDADTLWHTHPDVAEEVLRLAKTEALLKDAISDWRQPVGDETMSQAAVGVDTEGTARRSLAAGALERVGRYRIIHLLGEGGMGAVYAADDPELQRRVAIKLPHFNGSPDRQEQARRRFVREARSAAAVEHPNVCPIHDVGVHEGRPFVVMALIEGESLARRLQRGPRLPLRDAVSLIAKIARGLAIVHGHGIIHRDLKPANILLRRNDDEPILTDFGLAQISDDDDHLTADGMLLGTPAYMSPEQADPALGPITPRSDVYALGVILFEMATGRRPFEGATMQIIIQLGSAAIPRASEIRPGLNPALDALIARALSRRAADRFADAAAFADALELWSDGRSPPTVTLQRDRVAAAPRPTGARKFWISGAMAAVVVSGLAIYLSRDQLFPSSLLPLPQRPNIAGEDPDPPGPPVKVTPVAVRGVIDVKVWRKDDFDPVGKKLSGPGMSLHNPAALPVAPGDWLRIEVKLNRPAYCYVVWIDTEGQVTPLYPWLTDKWDQRPATEKRTDRLVLPDIAGELAVAPLGPGPAGMETLMLLTRDEPLPPEVDLGGVIGQLPPQKSQDLRAAAWFENGTLVTKELNRGPIRLDQAKVATSPVVQTQATVRTRLSRLFEHTRAVSFANRGDR